ncbi:MAG: chloramphenicol phosphotransferase CPT family protein [Firmicutes bacterium]|nr:chloramphenicol phosphotransferase CPT family protein [Bacillota bacterium]
MKKSRIIFLEGVSSSGKTTLAKALQARLPSPFFWLAGDTIWTMAPEKFKHDPEVIFPKIDAATINTIKLFSKLGIDVIVDMVPVIKSNKKFAKMLRGCPTLYVNVTCPVEELRRREQARGDRQIGLGESQLAGLSPPGFYDIIVDTHSHSSEECADQIIEMMNRLLRSPHA